jgi:hypothetical protein
MKLFGIKATLNINDFSDTTHITTALYCLAFNLQLWIIPLVSSNFSLEQEIQIYTNEDDPP